MRFEISNAAWLWVALGLMAVGTIAVGQTPEYVVTFHEPKVDVAHIQMPVEANQRIQFQYVGMMAFGLTIDNSKMLCCGAGAIRTVFKVDDRLHHPNSPIANKPIPLPPDRFGKVKPGTMATFTADNVRFTQMLEVIPSKAPPGTTKRPLDNMLIRYVIENKDTKPHKVGTRVRIDTMCGNNDGALFAAPTRPGEILNGTELKDKTLPDYVQIMEVPNLKAPGFNGHFTLKLPGNRIGPDRFVCTSHAGGDNGWDAPVVQANGDSDCILYWTPREIRPGEKIEMAYAYGQGIASIPDNEGRLRLTLGGNFEPGKIFAVQAFIEEPAPGMMVSLDLPPGMTLIEGESSQPAVTANERVATSAILWKARVDRPGEFSLRVRSSNGITETRTVTVARGQ